jgi:hypothetical protein
MLLGLLSIVPFGPASHAKDGTDGGPAVTDQGTAARAPESENKTGSAVSQEERIEQMEKKLDLIWRATDKAEDRTYFIKMMGGRLVGYVQVAVVALVIIAVAFPLAIWLISRKRILGLSGLSSEVVATLLVIEERQAKLANILKEIQGEIDYLHTMSVPDLKNLIQQAENYLKQNEIDLEKAGSKRPGAQSKQ